MKVCCCPEIWNTSNATQVSHRLIWNEMPPFYLTSAHLGLHETRHFQRTVQVLIWHTHQSLCLTMYSTQSKSCKFKWFVARNKARTSLTNHCLKWRVHFITPLPAHKPCPPHFAAEAKVAAGRAAKHLPADCGGWPEWSAPFAQFRSAKYLWFLSHAVRLVALQLADYPAAAVLLDAKQKSSGAHPSTTNRLSSQNRLVNKIMWYLLGKSSILQPGVYCISLVLSPKSFRRISARVYHISWDRDKLKTTLVSNIVVSNQVQVKADTPLSFTSHCHIILGSKPSFARLSSQSLRADLIWSSQNWTTKTLCGILLFMANGNGSLCFNPVVSCWLFLVSCFLFLVLLLEVCFPNYSHLESCFHVWKFFCFPPFWLPGRRFQSHQITGHLPKVKF